jgi:predicted PurR-regulated permease PerM
MTGTGDERRGPDADSGEQARESAAATPAAATPAAATPETDAPAERDGDVDPAADDHVRPTPPTGLPAVDWRAGAVVAVVLTAWLLFSAQALLNPLLVSLLIIFVLIPYRRTLWARRLLGVAIVVGLLWLIDRLGNALAPFAIAIVVAYFLDPVVDRLEERGVGRSLAIIIITVPIFAVVIALVLTIIPPLARQIGAFVSAIPGLVDTAINHVEPHLQRFSSLDLEQVAETHLPSLVDPLSTVASKITAGALGVSKGIGAGASIISFLVLTPLATFYALRDIDHLRDSITELIPRKSQTLPLLREIDTMLGRWLRGQLIVCSVLGVATWIGLALLDVPYAMLLGLMTGVFNIIPFVGFWLSFIPVILVSLTMPSPLWSVVKVAVFYLVIQAVESNLLSPRIVGGEVGLNPVVMILAIVVFSSLLGFIGVIVAVPVTAILALLFRRWRSRMLEARGESQS